MSKCPGLHCPGCGDGGGDGLVAVVVLVALAVIGAIIRAIWHALVEAAEIAALTVLAIAGLAAVAGLAYGALRTRELIRARQDQRRRPIAVQVVSVAATASPAALGASQPRTAAIEPPKGISWPLPGQWEQIPTDTDRSTS